MSRLTSFTYVASNVLSAIWCLEKSMQFHKVNASHYKVCIHPFVRHVLSTVEYKTSLVRRGQQQIAVRGSNSVIQANLTACDRFESIGKRRWGFALFTGWQRTYQEDALSVGKRLSNIRKCWRTRKSRISKLNSYLDFVCPRLTSHNSSNQSRWFFIWLCTLQSPSPILQWVRRTHKKKHRKFVCGHSIPKFSPQDFSKQKVTFINTWVNLSRCDLSCSCLNYIRITQTTFIQSFDRSDSPSKFLLLPSFLL